jgi:hypothetical protein
MSPFKHPRPELTMAALLSTAILLCAPAQAQPLVTSVNASTTSFTLPNQLRAQYSGVGQYGKIPLSGTGVITWKTKSEGTALQYEAGLEIGAFFYKSTVVSQGTVNAQGIHPLRTEEKNTGRQASVITVDPKNKLATVTGKDTALPFDAAGQDLLTVIAQLGTYVQTQPQWRTAGEQKTFAVYRPGGLKSLRFQSQGMQNVTVNGVVVPTVYVIQVPVDAAMEPDDHHQFWLDPARHGFPVKLRKTKSDGAYVELTLKDWQEQ